MLLQIYGEQRKKKKSPKCRENIITKNFCYTCSPQGDALLLVGLTDAVVAVALNVVAGVSIMQINIGWAVRVGTSTELWQVT